MELSEASFKLFAARRREALEQQVRMMATMQTMPNTVDCRTWTAHHRRDRITQHGPYPPRPAMGSSMQLPQGRGGALLPASRTASNASTTSYQSSRPASIHPGEASRDAACSGLLSLSPLNSPALAASVDVLATPDLIGIAMDSHRHKSAPPVAPLFLPAQRLCVQTSILEETREDLPLVSPTPTTEQLAKDGSTDELVGCEKPLSSTPDGCKLLKERPAPTMHVPDISKKFKRTGSMLQMSQDLLSLANQGPQGATSGLPRKPSLTCMDMLSGR